MTAPELETILRQFAAAPKAHKSGEALLDVVYADPGMNGFYYRERKSDSLAAFVRTDLVQALVAEAVAKERERIAVGLAATIGAIDHGCPSCVSTACDIFNGLETGWKLAMIEDEFGNEKYSDDNDRILVAAIRAGKGE